MAMQDDANFSGLGDDDEAGSDYRALIAKVDDAIIETRGDWTEKPALELFVKKEHSVLALYPSETDDNDDRRKAYARFLLSIVTQLWLGIQCSDMSFGAAWFVVAIVWQVLALAFGVLIRYPRRVPLVWPFAIVGLIAVLTLWDMIEFALLDPTESGRAFGVFGLSFFTNALFEGAAIAARHSTCWRLGAPAEDAAAGDELRDGPDSSYKPAVLAGSIEVGINGLAPSATDAIVKLPFKSDRDVYNQYVNFDGHLRTGLLMEDMDALAANVANAHCQLNRAAGEALVTASVDSIHMYREIEDAVGKDAEMKGFVTWCGRSSIEVQLELYDTANPADVHLVATFVMVARNMKEKKSVPVTKLHLLDDVDRIRFEMGEARNARRKRQRKENVFVKPPCEEEIGVVHEILISDATAHKSDARGDAVMTVQDTMLSTTIMTQPQERNTAGKIFGGWLMKNAFELARSVAYTHVRTGYEGAYPVLLFTDDIEFLKAVDLGSLLEFRAHIAFTRERCMSVEVETYAHNLKENTPKTKTNSFHFAFGARTATDVALPIRQVQPVSYKHAVRYIDGRRRVAHAHEETKLTDYFLQ